MSTVFEAIENAVKKDIINSPDKIYKWLIKHIKMFNITNH